METQKFSHMLIERGILLTASDLYILPTHQNYRLIYRCHEKIIQESHISLEDGEQLILFFKYLGEMDVGERRHPQLGSCCFNVCNQDIRLRLSSVGNYRQQESLVIRFLYRHSQAIYFFSTNQWRYLQRMTKRKGLHLFSGPVGSGKTTSMYQLAREQQNQVITIEDPVEIEEDVFLQLQVQPKIHIGYDELIKLCLRHRPDLMIIGEIRDEMTARYAIRAALTGHRVFATIHAKNTDGVWQRLLDLRVPESDMKQCVSTIIYQRLLPTYCPFCGYHCHPYCSHFKSFYRVLMDIYPKDPVQQLTWNHLLLDAWKVGAISDETYQTAKNETGDSSKIIKTVIRTDG